MEKKQCALEVFVMFFLSGAMNQNVICNVSGIWASFISFISHMATVYNVGGRHGS